MKRRHIASVRTLAAAAPLLAALVGVGAQAQTTGAVFAGADHGRDWSVAAGAVAAPIDSRWAVRAIVSTGGYDYSSNGATVDADYDQAEMVVLHRHSGSWGYLNVGGGARYTDTRLSPDDAGNGRRGGQWDALLTADGVRRTGDWETGAFVSYGVDMNEYYVRARITRRLESDRSRLGLEIVAQGDETYDRQGIALVAIRRVGSMEFAASAGVRGGDGQVSLGVVRTF